MESVDKAIVVADITVPESAKASGDDAASNDAGQKAKEADETPGHSNESASMIQARELLENLCKKHIDAVDDANAPSTSTGLKNSSDLVRLRDQIWNLFSAEKTDIDYLESPAFRNKIRLVEQGCVRHPNKKKIHIKELVDNMIVNTPKSEEQRKKIEFNRSRKVKNSKEKLIEALGATLNQTILEINKREQENGFEEGVEDEGVERECNYIYVDRLKRRAIVIYNKIQELECNSTTTMRESHRPIIVRSTSYPEINRAAGKMATRCARKDFTPDFNDVITIIRRVNESENLGMSEERQRSVAEGVFKEIVEEIKKRRIKETRLNIESIEIEFGHEDECDPAEKDSELEARLKESEVEGRKRIAAVINEFADKQNSVAQADDKDGAVEGTAQNQDRPTVSASSSKEAESEGGENKGGGGEHPSEASPSNGKPKPSDDSSDDKDEAKMNEDDGPHEDDDDEEDDIESEMDESYLYSDDSEVEKEGAGKRKRPKVASGGGGEENADGDDFSQMALEDLTRPEVPQRLQGADSGANTTGDEEAESPASESQPDVDSRPGHSSESNCPPVTSGSSQAGIRNDRSGSASSMLMNGDGGRGRKVRRKHPTERQTAEVTDVHEVSDDDVETMVEVRAVDSAKEPNECMDMILVESLADDESLPPRKLNGHHSLSRKRDRAGPKSSKRPFERASNGEEGPPRKMAIIELSDDSQDLAEEEEHETIVADDSVISCGLSITGRLRALGTNVVPVGRPVARESPEVIEIDSD